MIRHSRYLLWIFLLLILLLAGCGGKPKAEVTLAPLSQLPTTLRSAPANVQEAYRFAVANKDLLEQIPCFCGCNGIGHGSNYACYVAEDGGPGDVVVEYDNHALF